MKHLRIHSVLSLLLLLCAPAFATGDAETAQPTFSFPQDGDHLLIEAREIVGSHRDPSQPAPNPVPYGQTSGHVRQLEIAEWRTWRLFGNGRIEESTFGDSPKTLATQLDPSSVEQLLRILDHQLDLPKAQTLEPPPAYQPFVAIHLSRYISADWQHTIDFLDAVATEDLQLAFRELSAITQWATLKEGLPIWNPGSKPAICDPVYRSEQGLPGPPTVWCTFLLQQPEITFVGGDPSLGENPREAVRERLRERLRNLPRGLQDSVRTEEQP